MRLPRKRTLFAGLAAALILLPTVAFAIYKPSRVLAPHLFGVTCVENNICIDDPAHLKRAKRLRAEAIDFVHSNIAHIRNTPRMIFCHSLECSDAFGQFHAAAFNVGTHGIVVRMRGWERHFVRHELIHHVQNERFGSLYAFVFLPTWYLEGMAYSLSLDPRKPIPDETLEGYRARFDAWAATQESIWDISRLD
ncbi:hypothetical protein ACFQ14_08255 [Pseudahrensia aquimaris]|uniref:DUF4157 domain-containing protein n=1 Tax=Pseudahrensia aquimaris TaxID=744461 RepID=A0ABW3FGL0_9HYPH